MNVRKKITNACGQARRVFYDAIGRITGYTSREGAVSYTYDVNRYALTVNNSNGTITRTYDTLNRVFSFTESYSDVIHYEYDAVGIVTPAPDSRLLYESTLCSRSMVKL